VTRSTFPYVTVAMLEQDGDSLLSWVATLWPEAAPMVRIAQQALKLVNSLSTVNGFLQHVADEINQLTGATSPA